MGKVIMFNAVSMDGYIADSADAVGPLFDWYTNGDVEVTMADEERVFRMTVPSAAFIREITPNITAGVIGRHLFDITNGWNGRPPAGEHVFVVTHEPPPDWPFPDAPFTFVTDGVPSAVQQAKAYAGDRDISVNGGDVGGQAFAAGLIDEVVLNLVPVVMGTGVPYFGHQPEDFNPVLFENPRVIEGDRVLHLHYKARKR